MGWGSRKTLPSSHKLSTHEIETRGVGWGRDAVQPVDRAPDVHHGC